MKIRAVSFLFFLVVVWLNSSLEAGNKPAWWQQSEKEALAEGYQLVTVDQAIDLSKTQENLVIIDVRPDYEYEMGHLPQAVNLEIDLADRMQLSTGKKNRLEQLLGKDRNRPILLYCRSYS